MHYFASWSTMCLSKIHRLLFKIRYDVGEVLLTTILQAQKEKEEHKNKRAETPLELLNIMNKSPQHDLFGV